MELNLRCTKCGDPWLVTIDELCALWRRGYEGLCREHRPHAEVSAEISCHCGHTDVYDTPMFAYTFQLIFEELVRE